MNRDIEKGSPGQFFDDYLKEQGIYEATTEQAVKRVLAFQVAESGESLQNIMQEISRNAQRRGLTPDILQAILDEE